MILFIGAMQEELGKFANDINAKTVEGSAFKEKITDDNQVIVCWTGIGISNACIVLSNLLTKYKIDKVINLGTAGAISKELHQANFVVIENTSYSMADSTGFGYVYGQLPGMPKFYTTNEELKNIIIDSLGEDKFIVGNTASSDTFFESNDKVRDFSSKLPFEAHIAEMECAGYAQTTSLFNVPFAALKIVSDVIGMPNPNEDQFEKFLPKAAEKLSTVGQELIKRLF